MKLLPGFPVHSVPLLVLSLYFFLPGNADAFDCIAGYKRLAARYNRMEKTGAFPAENCRSLMREFSSVASDYPSCHKADDALYMAGVLGVRAYRSGGSKKDLESALRAFNGLVEGYPESTLADDAAYYSGEVHLLLGNPGKARQAFLLTTGMRGGDMVKKAREKLDELPEGKAPLQGEGDKTACPAESAEPARSEEAQAPAASMDRIPEADIVKSTFGLGRDEEEQRDDTRARADKDGSVRATLLRVRYWSSDEYTRVVVDLDKEVPYAPAHLLRPDPELGTPPRLYVDFKRTRLSDSFKEHGNEEEYGCYSLPIGDGLLKKARAGQYRQDVARVVLDIKKLDHFNAFALPGKPFRYVLDVYGEPRENRPAVAEGPREQLQKPSDGPGPLRRVPPANKFIVVLDAGHGGRDPGAVGPSGAREKDITLALAELTKARLEKKRDDVQVVLTRKDDAFLGLVDRTALANTLNADLFVSIHCNASTNSAARGVETYFLDNTTDRAALKLAAKENFVDESELMDSMDTTNLILADLITASKVEDSVPLARSVQKHVVSSLHARWADVPDKGVKKAPFWVLTGATMPCVLAEVSFISNRTEERRLSSLSYQRTAAEGIADGIISYLDSYERLSMAD